MINKVSEKMKDIRNQTKEELVAALQKKGEKSL